MTKVAPSRKVAEAAKKLKVQIFAFPKLKSKISFFGKGKNLFGDGVKFQKEIRKEWQ